MVWLSIMVTWVENSLFGSYEHLNEFQILCFEKEVKKKLTSLNKLGHTPS